MILVFNCRLNPVVSCCGQPIFQSTKQILANTEFVVGNLFLFPAVTLTLNWTEFNWKKAMHFINIIFYKHLF